MITKITADNAATIEVGQLGITVVHPEGITSIWARLTPEQRAELAAALGASPGAAQSAPAVDRDLVEAALAEGLRRGLTVDQLARSVCAAIDCEPAPDPVEQLAEEIDGAVRDAVRKGFDFIDSVTGIGVDQKVVDSMLTWLPNESRALARRAFGQEADQ